jgi:hypothetical protein
VISDQVSVASGRQELCGQILLQGHAHADVAHLGRRGNVEMTFVNKLFPSERGRGGRGGEGWRETENDREGERERERERERETERGATGVCVQDMYTHAANTGHSGGLQ